jgi:hypothetical protein
VGTVIEYFYTINKKYIYDSSWLLSEDLFTKRAYFYLSKYSSLQLRWNCPVGLPPGTPQPNISWQGASLEIKDVPAFKVEDYMPPTRALKYRVEFIYAQKKRAESDPTIFWMELGKQWYEAFEKFVNEPKAMRKAVAGIISDNDSPEAKLQKIYARMKQIHNISFDPQKSEQERKREERKDIKNVEDIWKLGYGNAREINWLFIALARAAGFDADCVVVSARNSDFFDSKMMNPSQLNADVVLIKLQGKDIYLDPGAMFAPFGLLPWYETQVRGMRLTKDGGQWVETSSPDSALARTERKANLTLSEDGTLEGKLTVSFGGLEALELRIDGWNDDDASRKETLERMVKEMLPDGADVQLTNKPDWTSAENTLVAEYNLKVPGYASNAGRRTILPLGLFGTSEKNLFVHAERIHPVYFPYPYLKSDEISIKLPQGWAVNSVPKPFTQEASAIGYALKSEAKNGSLRVNRVLRIDLVTVPVNQYGTLRKFFDIVRTQDEQQAVLQPLP